MSHSPESWPAPVEGPPKRRETLLVQGVEPRVDGPVNLAVQRASTILYSDVLEYERRHEGFYDRVIYGLYGTENAFALAADVAHLENGYRTVITASGTAAIALSLVACAKSGDHVLVADCVYGATRRFCDDMLSRFGVEVEYFDPLALDQLESRIRPTTAAMFLESPGSQTFEMSDVPALAAVARRHGVRTLIDNTWATPLFFRPLEHGVDVSIQSATKYFCGHSDVMLGAITVRDPTLHERIKDTVGRFGDHASADDCYLVQRGLRTLDVRLRRHQANALALIERLASRSDVLRVLYPALQSDPGHGIWRRDYGGASGLFGVVLRPEYFAVRKALFDGLQVFKIGSSWGGYESLMVPAAPAPVRRFRPAPTDGFLVRIHAGLEHVDDLAADLDAALDRAARAAST